MAARKKAIEKAVSPLDQPERFRLGEMGSLGLRTFSGVTQDELKAELNWPRSINTFRDMSYHSAVNAPLTLFENIILCIFTILSFNNSYVTKLICFFSTV